MHILFGNIYFTLDLGPFCLPKRSMTVESERKSFYKCITVWTFVSETGIHPSLEEQEYYEWTYCR